MLVWKRSVRPLLRNSLDLEDVCKCSRFWKRKIKRSHKLFANRIVTLRKSTVTTLTVVEVLCQAVQLGAWYTVLQYGYR
jgi:hypothetical protein